jgi:hypothetical protein
MLRSLDLLAGVGVYLQAAPGRTGQIESAAEQDCDSGDQPE